MTTGALASPRLDDLASAVSRAATFAARTRGARTGHWCNAQGGDVASTGSWSSLVRHVANYLAAADLAHQAGAAGPLVDVGSGTGALGAWLADRLGLSLQLVDADARLRAVAAAAFPQARVCASVAELPAAAAGMVTAMEVIEHVSPGAQPAFAAALVAALRPGGLLVVSTPDESGYPGGWSGYYPHVGILDAQKLRLLLEDASGTTAAVWRLEGEPFHLGPVRRVLEPAANRLWGAASRAAPGLGDRLAPIASAVAGVAPSVGRRGPPAQVRAVAPGRGTGTGLLGAVQLPMD